jgi:TRAP-type mannitol/chloroaromatic compound transport system permease small subunit
MELILFLIMPLLALPLWGSIVAAILALAHRVGAARQRWAMRLLATLMMVIPFILWFIYDRVEAANCRALLGPDERSCAGEIGGLIILFFQFYLIVGGLIIGPVIGSSLHKHLSQVKP